MGKDFHSTQQTRAKQTSKESKTVDGGKDATRTMLDQTLEVKTMEGEMGGPRMALLVVIPKTAEAANATKTTMVEVEDRHRTARVLNVLDATLEMAIHQIRVSPTSQESKIAPQGPLAIRTM